MIIIQNEKEKVIQDKDQIQEIPRIHQDKIHKKAQKDQIQEIGKDLIQE